MKILSHLAFGLCLTVLAWRAYQYPEYSTDEFSYMANVLAMHGASIQEMHDTVYREAREGIPKPIFDHLSGHDPGAPLSENLSFRERAANPYHFAEFLPCFAIRPVFNELVYILHFKLGIGLLKATVVLPVACYFLLGWLVLTWVSRYANGPWVPTLISLLLMMSTPMWELGRSATPDALSALAVLTSVYLIFEKQKLVEGIVLLLASVYIRTDNVVLVLAVVAYLFLVHKRLNTVEGVVLSGLAVASVVLINHFAGDYGPRVLYYRSFVEPPTAVGELVPNFGVREYLTALRSGLDGALHGPYILFFLMGVVGLLRRPSPALLGVSVTTCVYTVAHLIIFPNPETRFFGPFFVAMTLLLASTLAASAPDNQRSFGRFFGSHSTINS